MESNYRIHVTIRRQNGSIFNSMEYCTEGFGGISPEQTASKIAADFELWGTENINASEEQIKDGEDDTTNS